MEKECEICGTWFEAVRSDRKYCDKCQRDSGKAKKYIDRAIMASKDRMDDAYAPVNLHCPICNKIFAVPKKFRQRDYLCCSYDCRQKYKEIQRAETEAKRKAREELLPTIVCQQCGKEFKGYGNRKFCCKECYTEYQKTHSESTVEKAVGDIERVCEVCGAKFIVHKDKPTPVKALAKCCSQQCRVVLSKEGYQKRSAVRSEWIKNYEAEMKAKEYAVNGLCGYCKTSYKECERMQSEFRVIPKGAKFNNNGKIITCPKFKE